MDTSPEGGCLEPIAEVRSRFLSSPPPQPSLSLSLMYAGSLLYTHTHTHTAQMIQRHVSTLLSDAVKAVIEAESISRLLPLVLAAAGAMADLATNHTVATCLHQLLDRASQSVLRDILPAPGWPLPPATAASAGMDTEPHPWGDPLGPVEALYTIFHQQVPCYTH